MAAQNDNLGQIAADDADLWREGGQAVAPNIVRRPVFIGRCDAPADQPHALETTLVEGRSWAGCMVCRRLFRPGVPQFLAPCRRAAA